MPEQQKPLTLTLSQRERGLIGGYCRGTPTWKYFIESIIDGIFPVMENGRHLDQPLRVTIKSIIDSIFQVDG